ncbi:tetraacyldisaccharide 4'-kinase [Flammeovirgaceae bacterium SG7u.111]|nr:tetraacyldisaccharide 4'-kinase [Flammeovirgaceae bacterium SG7u.132]WPO34519.1 tetraacyldisaccharide 4'-kinase [Flammeovirgaceae bacterium SG7u.111]
MGQETITTQMFAKILLYPFSLLYHFATWLRNRTYDSGMKNSVSFDLPTISVGNLTVGGTGKTPHIEYLIRLLKPSFKLATLSRGYGRKTKGFVVAEEGISATQLGDEPMQFFQKYGSEVLVTVCEERLYGIPAILMEEPETDIVLLDDAYQHRQVKPGVNILLSDFNRPFYKDLLLPAGRLRESRKGAERADIVIVSKCPTNLLPNDMLAIKKEIRAYISSQIPIYFTCFDYGKPVQLLGAPTETPRKIVLVTGIANTKYLEEYIGKHFEMVEHLRYPDHHTYTAAIIDKIKASVEKAGEYVSVITTEKDATKLANGELGEMLKELPVFALPIEVKFLGGEAEQFAKQVLGKVEALQPEGEE